MIITKYKINCPVCGKEIETTRYASEYGTEEEYYNCENCGYSYEFVYGHYVKEINGKEFHYSYLTKEEDLSEMYDEYKIMKQKYKTNIES